MRCNSVNERLRGIAPWLRSALMALALLCGAQAFSQTTNVPFDPIDEKQYWEKLHQRQEQQRTDEERWQNEHREKVKTAAVEIINAQDVIQSELIVAEDGPSQIKQETPSIVSRYPEHVALGVAMALLLGLVAKMMFQFKREAEIRRLCGGYLSDGTEVAAYQLPDWFSPPPRTSERGISAAFSIATPARASAPQPESRPDPLAEFFLQAPEHLRRLRELLKVLTDPAESDQRKTVFAKANEIISELQQKAECGSLRPAWQMSSALELFIQRVAEKPTAVTPSAMRTIASAVDVLSELCVPGIRPDLLTEPPIKILAVDDDALCRRAIQYALAKAHLTPDLAEDGEQAVALATNNTYDVVFMDIMMPKMDGLTACTKILELKRNEHVPVIFVTALSDFNTRAQSRLKGGVDLIAKPFLVLELTVKAITHAMRRRLQTAHGAAAETQPENASVTKSPGTHGSAPAATAPTQFHGTDLSGDFFAEIPAYLSATRKLVEELRAANAAEVQARMEVIYLRVHAIAAKARLTGLQIAGRVGSALEALLTKLYGNPKSLTPSTLNTVDNALKLLEGLCVRGIDVKLAGDPPVRILVVDDEPLALGAVTSALQMAFEKPESAENGASGCVFAAQNIYDVIFTDVQMPLMDGFALCRDIRAGNTNRETPVIFIANHADAPTQAQAYESGANDFIGKPFLPIEITVKALTFAWERRLRKLNAAGRAENLSAPTLSPTASSSPVLAEPVAA